MREDPKFLSVKDAYAIHDFSSDEFGGAHEVRDPGAFEGALQAPVNYWSYSGLELNSDTFGALAAIYWFHVSGNHPFIDGNKRTAFLCAKAFLDCNGLDLLLENEEVIDLGFALARGEISRDELIAKVQNVLVERSS